MLSTSEVELAVVRAAASHQNLPSEASWTYSGSARYINLIHDSVKGRTRLTDYCGHTYAEVSSAKDQTSRQLKHGGLGAHLHDITSGAPDGILHCTVHVFHYCFFPCVHGLQQQIDCARVHDWVCV